MTGKEWLMTGYEAKTDDEFWAEVRSLLEHLAACTHLGGGELSVQVGGLADYVTEEAERRDEQLAANADRRLEMIKAAACGDPACLDTHFTPAQEAEFDQLATAYRDRFTELALKSGMMARPPGAEHVPAPETEEDARIFVGVLMHFVGGSEELCTRLARWMEHHEGDLDEQIVLWYLTECHRIMEPECTMPIDGDMHPGRPR